MDLYFSPLACSLATRIAFYEAGEDATYLEVDPKTKRVQNDSSDFRNVNPLGLVPTLRTDEGQVLTENAAILQYVADQKPDSKLVPKAGTIERYRVLEWLNFITSEIHKTFSPLFNPAADASVKAYTTAGTRTVRMPVSSLIS